MRRKAPASDHEKEDNFRVPGNRKKTILLSVHFTSIYSCDAMELGGVREHFVAFDDNCRLVYECLHLNQHGSS